MEHPLAPSGFVWQFIDGVRTLVRDDDGDDADTEEIDVVEAPNDGDGVHLP